MFLKLIKKNRTVRRYDRSIAVTESDIAALLECARLTASAGNFQRLRYSSVVGTAAEEAFSSISLGGFLPDDKKPNNSVAPSAYIVLASESETPDANLLIDTGISAEAITLAACEKGIGACMIRNFKREFFSFSSNGTDYYPILVIALGYPAEEPLIYDAYEGDSLKYSVGDDFVNRVPKLTLIDLWKNKNK